MPKKINTKKGFTLLVAIVVTAMLLIISFVVANIAYKQVLLANSNQESQYAFYNADSGIECAVYWDFKGATSAFTQPLAGSPVCNGQALGISVVSTATTTFTLNFSAPGKGCVKVEVGKYVDGTTIIDSKGYNNCTGGTTRRLERGEKLSYTNTGGGGGGGGGGTGMLGYDTLAGSWSDSGDAGYISAAKFTMPVGISGTATSISVYIPNPDLAPGNNSYKVAIYADSAGAPGALLAQSSVGTLVTGWNTISISQALTANTPYWLAYNANSTNGLSNYNIFPGSAGQWAYRVLSFASSFPASFGPLDGNPPNTMLIYATYSIP